MREISLDNIEKYSKNYETRNLKTLQNSVQKNGINNATFNTKASTLDQHIYSLDIKTGKVSNQKQSGRCWMFAALNNFRHKLNKDFNILDFELSQTYTFFWDKLEKSNYFLENIIKTKDEDIDSRIVRFLLTTPQQDGGQWDMLVSIIKKYGIVPKYVMPDVFHSTSSVKLNSLLNKKLRQAAVKLRKLNENKASLEELVKEKELILDEIYSFLAVSLGEPPKSFDFEFEDKDGKFVRDANITPKEFYDKYVGIDLDDYVSIINAPTKDKPYYNTFTVSYLGNVISGRDVKYLNVPMDVLKKLAISQLQDGYTVWFGCDVGQSSDRVLGLMDLDIFDINNSYNINFDLTKEEALDYCDSLMTHAMVLSGVNLVDGVANRWKVENSWGEEPGKKGYFLMTDAWMDRYTYQVVINKKYLTEEMKKSLEKEPIVLKPWDPMGSLAFMK
ncbi:C1 family peptidase [Oceanivirga miroungae]|uniref:Aminopeptidase n=1 Tax=Oceanivirga miroungae TaxID=1130046 RepID=A0A6I8M9W2_9FUSO|nr:C1 family peptidase [Oceanivirga miroungae]VWL85608.1 Aminopeptidase C [Oceanivirga miroungae]